MRITFLLPILSLNGGIRVVAEYGRELLKLGHEVTFVVRRAPLPRIRDVLRGRAPLLPVNEDPTAFFDDIVDHIEFFPAYRRIRASDLPDADFLVCTWWETVEWAQSMPPQKGRLAHLMQAYEMFPWLPHQRIAATYEVDSIKISVSQWISDSVLTNHGQKSAAIIHNAVDATRFTYKEKLKSKNLKLGFLYSSPIFKNSEMAFAVQDIMKSRGISTQLVSFGSDNMPKDLASREDTTFYHRPSQERIPEIYQECDLWLFTSLEEGFGLPLLEAFACGTPVVSSRAGAAPQLVVTDRNGYLCDTTPDDFADAIQRFSLMEAEERKKMGLAARATVENWDWATASRQLAEILVSS